MSVPWSRKDDILDLFDDKPYSSTVNTGVRLVYHAHWEIQPGYDLKQLKNKVKFSKEGGSLVERTMLFSNKLW